MFSGDLKAAADKLSREQRERAERERLRLEKEKAIAERQRQRQAAREEEARRRREAAEAAAIAEAERIEALRESNRGVFWSATLAAAPADEASVTSRGIKRSRDKISLPPSVGSELMAQDAPKNGAMFFELRTPGGTVAHAGLLEFTAPEGVALLPRDVAAALWGLGAEPSGPVTVTYTRLEKGTFVRFQPEGAAFHSAVDDIRGALEGALRSRCTLTQGEWLEVADGQGARHNLRVAELRPGPAVSVLDTDIEAEVVPSLESEERVRAVEEAARREADAAAASVIEQLAQEALAAAAAAAAEAAAAQAAAAAERRRAEKEAGLPPEPFADEPGVLTVALRLPDGSRCGRRFRPAEPLTALFDFAEARGAAALAPGGFRLVSQFPRAVYENEPGAGSKSLADAGLSGQAVLLLEPLAAAQ